MYCILFNQAAVGAYYDFNSSQSVEKLPNMEFLQDITVGEGEAVPPSTRFIKTWRLKNNGKLLTNYQLIQQCSFLRHPHTRRDSDT